MPVIRHAESRRTETPNAVMTTLASPAQGGASQVVWRVDMTAGQAGPVHAIDAEQVWTVLGGEATVELGDDSVTVGTGDTIVIPADVTRRITSGTPDGLTAIVVAPAGMRAYGTTAPVDPHCALPDAGKLVPAWVV
ncbi:cupin domain-containing protein [Nonomuraea sp. SBT364]|uniref:cupin domain-containing protein n=1 Tax=Nonomuraea sp. SBT364 TaxID=1580530 RepID=UPI00066D4246|nr:cupin domain-containing protein [Nonomuraea sp. SBT364]